MFFDKWIPKKFLVKQEVCSVEVVFNENGRNIYLTLLKQKGNKVDVALKETLKDLKLPAKIIKSKVPVILILNGTGIITKKASSNETDTEKIISESFPAIQSEQFCIQLFRQASGIHHISFCRKSLVNDVISELKRENVEPVSVYLGPSVVIGMEPVWSSFNKIPTTLVDAEITNGSLADFVIGSGQADISIGEIVMGRTNTIGFAAGLNYFLGHSLAYNSDKALDRFYNKHIESNKLRFSMVVCVGIALIAALLNVFFYTGYYDKNNKLEAELGVYESKNARINKLLEDYQKKKGLIEGAGVLDINHLSEYADRIAATVPAEVILTNLYFNPKMENDNNADSLVTFRNKELVVQGNCNKSLIINDWINILKLQKFIKEVDLEKFNFSKEGFLPNFEIQIQIQ